MTKMKSAAMPEREMLRDAAEYFKNNSILDKTVNTFCQKYRILGHWGGTAEFVEITLTDKKILSAFLCKDFTAVNKIKISYKALSKAWLKTRFTELPLEDFLQYYYNGSLISKKEAALSYEEERQKLLDGLLLEYDAGPAKEWLLALKCKKIKLYRKEFETDKELLQLMAKALSSLPEDYERIPFFANRISGNPHGFDWDCPAGNLLRQALSFLDGESIQMSSIDARTELLYKHNLLRDDILNFATVLGMRAFSKENEIIYWRAAAEINAPLNLPLKEIVRAKRIIPYALGNKREKTLPPYFSVYIVENSGVFSTISDMMQYENIEIPLLCLHGQLKMASWALLDKLQDSGAEFYYSGDFDPEGLIIAQKILYRYPGRAKLWHFTAEQYKKAGITLPQKRLLKLQHITHPALKEQAALMQEQCMALYQESFVDELLEDLRAESAAEINVNKNNNCVDNDADV